MPANKSKKHNPYMIDTPQHIDRCLANDPTQLKQGRNQQGYTPLICAIRANKNFKLITAIIEKAHIDVCADYSRDGNGWLPIHHAIQQGRRDLVESFTQLKDANLFLLNEADKVLAFELADQLRDETLAERIKASLQKSTPSTPKAKTKQPSKPGNKVREMSLRHFSHELSQVHASVHTLQKCVDEGKSLAAVTKQLSKTLSVLINAPFNRPLINEADAQAIIDFLDPKAKCWEDDVKVQAAVKRLSEQVAHRFRGFNGASSTLDISNCTLTRMAKNPKRQKALALARDTLHSKIKACKALCHNGESNEAKIAQLFSEILDHPEAPTRLAGYLPRPLQHWQFCLQDRDFVASNREELKETIKTFVCCYDNLLESKPCWLPQPKRTFTSTIGVYYTLYSTADGPAGDEPVSTSRTQGTLFRVQPDFTTNPAGRAILDLIHGNASATESPPTNTIISR